MVYTRDVYSDAYIDLGRAREDAQYKKRDGSVLTGKGLAVAIIDTGINTVHIAFTNRILYLPLDDPSDTAPIKGRMNWIVSSQQTGPRDIRDVVGHGTNIAGIVTDSTPGILGIAYRAHILPLKVMSRAFVGPTGAAPPVPPATGPELGTNFGVIAQALEAVVRYAKFSAGSGSGSDPRVSVVVLSLSDGGNYQSADQLLGGAGKETYRKTAEAIRKLYDLNIVVVVASGNAYKANGCKAGLGFPAILPETISVGAVYDRESMLRHPTGLNVDGTPKLYSDQSFATATAEDQICPFSQRLPKSKSSSNPPARSTDIFAPGAPIIAAGIPGTSKLSPQSGTSQAAPVVAGIVLLAQELYLDRSGKSELPGVEVVRGWLQSSGAVGKTVCDELYDPPRDNVLHLGREYVWPRLSAPDVFGAVLKSL